MAVKPLKPEDIKFLAVHCSASQPNRDIGVKDIDRWHRARGFVGIGYHFVIRRDGTLEEGRPVTQRGAHVEDWNHCSLGICLVGGVDSKLKPENNFTPAQFDKLRSLLEMLTGKYPQAQVQGHRDFPHVNKACPSFDVRSWFTPTSPT